MPIPTTETRMPGHRRHKRSSAGSSSVPPPARAAASHRKPSGARAASSHRKPLPAKRISSAEAESSGHGRSKRSSTSEAAAASYPTWVMLCRVGARRDSFRGDRTTSAVSCTSGGEEISVSFELVKPPRTSLLTLDWPQGPRPSEGSTSYPIVIAAHRNAVLLEIIYGAKYRRPAGIDHFVYKAGGEYPSLTRLPVCYWKGPSNTDNPRPRRMSREAVGLLSYSNELFIVAELESTLQLSSANIYLLCSGSEDWKVFKNVRILHADGIPHLCWWSTDMVLAHGRRCLIWVDYFRGMIIADMTHPGNDILDPQEPVLQYVPLPVDPVQGNPYHSDYGRGHPEIYRSLCDTRHGIKFVSVNKYGCNFSITLWSLCEDQTWTEDATLDDDQLWDLDYENCLPKILPEFPMVDMENPDVVCFLMSKGRHTANPEAPTWMVKVHMKKKILLDCIDYSNKESSSCQNAYTTARIMSKGFSFVASELSCYLSP